MPVSGTPSETGIVIETGAEAGRLRGAPWAWATEVLGVVEAGRDRAVADPPEAMEALRGKAHGGKPGPRLKHRFRPQGASATSDPRGRQSPGAHAEALWRDCR